MPTKEGIGGHVDDSAMQLGYGHKMLYPQMGGLDATGGLGAGAPLMGEIGTTGQAGLLMGAAGDVMYWTVLLKDLLIKKDRDVHARVHFCALNEDTGIDWIATILGIKAGDAITDAVSSPDGTIAFAAAASIASHGWVATEYNSFRVPDKFDDDVALLVTVECDSLGTTDANEIKLLGLELKYTLSLQDPSGVRRLT